MGSEMCIRDRYNIGGAILGLGRWNGGYIRIFPLLPFGVPITPTYLRVGGTDLPQVWCGDRSIIGPCQVCFGFPINAAIQKYGGPKTISVVIWAKIWDIFPSSKKGGSMGRISVDVL